jgi:hypothetical protein
MTRSERAVVARSIGLMAEFARLARLPGSDSTLAREACLINPGNPDPTAAKLLRLVQQHRSEWDDFVNALPPQSWVREIVDRYDDLQP